MNQINRRQFLAQGGAAVSLGAILAACGNTAGPTAPGRLGSAAPPATLPTVTVDDTVLIRTAQSLHYSAIEVFERLIKAGSTSTAVGALLPGLVEFHKAQATKIGSEGGATAFECANPFVTDRYIDPTFEVLDGPTSTNPEKDSDKIAIAFEEWIARSHQDLVSALSDPKLRTSFLTVAVESSRASAALSLAAGEGDGKMFNPVLLEEDPIDKDEDGYPIYWVIPARFGQLTAVNLVVGEIDSEGQRFSVNLATPADNTYIEPDATCK